MLLIPYVNVQYVLGFVLYTTSAIPMSGRLSSLTDHQREQWRTEEQVSSYNTQMADWHPEVLEQKKSHQILEQGQQYNSMQWKSCLEIGQPTTKDCLLLWLQISFAGTLSSAENEQQVQNVKKAFHDLSRVYHLTSVIPVWLLDLWEWHRTKTLITE